MHVFFFFVDANFCSMPTYVATLCQDTKDAGGGGGGGEKGEMQLAFSYSIAVQLVYWSMGRRRVQLVSCAFTEWNKKTINRRKV